MIKSFVAFTDEIDNPEAAINELSVQINDNGELLSHTVGIVNCHYEFLESETYKAIAEALPFPICGMTTPICGGGPSKNGKGESGELFFTLLVLTSDDVSFEVGVSEEIALGDNYEEAIKNVFSDNKKPGLLLVTAPTIEVIPGDDLMKICEKFIPDVPIFGGFSIDDSPRYNENVYTLAKGEFYKNRVVFLKLFGNVHPRFYSASISRNKINKSFAVVTESKGSEIISLNDRPVLEYLESIGLFETIIENGIVANYALVINEDDTGSDEYYARTMLRLSPQKTLICGGDIPQGAHLRIGQFEKLDTIDSGRGACIEAFSKPADVVITMSSISRATLLGADIFHGINTVKNAANAPFIMIYAGGEICPVMNGKGFKNRFNNQSFNACVL
ncbi:MAG: FIST C-terminal domain-containing protein [Ruminococcus sp.]|nr:FIST C-terminal domain-containing protein [Ruminococcus sp.]